MNHKWTPNENNTRVCFICARDFLAHTPAARCEVCQKISKCDIYDDVLKCFDCRNDEVVKNHRKLELVMSGNREVAKKIDRIDSSIRYSGDIFNAKTVAIEELRRAFRADESIPEHEKNFAFQRALAERFTHLKEIISNLENTEHELMIQKQDLKVEQLAISKTLRDFGNNLRAEIREQIRQNDANYNPPYKVVKPKVAKITKSPFDRMVEALAIANNCSLEAAKTLLEKGMKQ